MPIYLDRCTVCGAEKEEIRSIHAAPPIHCGQLTVRVPQPAGCAFITAGGNWYNRTPAAGRVYKAGGRAKPKTIGKGHGLGGRRKNPSFKTMRKAGNEGAPSVVASLQPKSKP